MIDRLSNKVAIVTGGGSGFGEAISERFVAEGANVLVVTSIRVRVRRLPGGWERMPVFFMPM